MYTGLLGVATPDARGQCEQNKSSVTAKATLYLDLLSVSVELRGLEEIIVFYALILKLYANTGMQMLISETHILLMV